MCLCMPMQMCVKVCAYMRLIAIKIFKCSTKGKYITSNGSLNIQV